MAEPVKRCWHEDEKGLEVEDPAYYCNDDLIFRATLYETVEDFNEGKNPVLDSYLCMDGYCNGFFELLNSEHKKNYVLKLEKLKEPLRPADSYKIGFLEKKIESLKKKDNS